MEKSINFKINNKFMCIKNTDIIWPAYFVVFDLSAVKNLNNIISYIIPTYIIYIKYVCGVSNYRNMVLAVNSQTHQNTVKFV